MLVIFIIDAARAPGDGLSGARNPTTLIDRMKRRAPGCQKPIYTLASVCAGIGQTKATLMEWVG